MVDFTGGTWRSLIDGSEVSAIPDSADLNIVASDYDGGNNNWVANIGPDVPDARNSPSKNQDTINGTTYDIVRYEDDASQTTELSSSTDPVAFVFVGQSVTEDDNGIPVDGGSSLELAMNDDNNDDGWRLFRGGTEGTDGNAGSSDTNYHIYTLKGINGDEIELRIDGTSVIGPLVASSSSVTGVTIGDRGDVTGNNADDLRVRELTRLNNYASGDVSQEEQRLADKYGFSI